LGYDALVVFDLPVRFVADLLVEAFLSLFGLRSARPADLPALVVTCALRAARVAPVTIGWTR
jgi:hypothetical protein